MKLTPPKRIALESPGPPALGVARLGMRAGTRTFFRKQNQRLTAWYITKVGQLNK